VALRTQQIIANESGIAKTADPLGGSYFVEHLTSKLEKQAMEEIQAIDRMGGMLKTIENGYVKREILRSAYEKQLEIEAGRRVIVGVNKFKPEKRYGYKALLLPDSIQRTRVAQLRRMKKKRRLGSVASQLERIKAAASSSRNVMPEIADAVKAGCTVGEISDVLREVFGEYKPGSPV
jgi:methylmalonyl-CoA mutase N-terminal domain/subunit